MGIKSYIIKEKYKRLLHDEKGTIKKNPVGKIRVALAFPNNYSIGMSNLGLHKLYGVLNSLDFVFCERVFLPESQDIRELQKSNTPLFSLETQHPVNEFDILAFSIPFELDYLNVLKILSLSRILPKSDDRKKRDPFVIAGGVCPTLNPEPIADFMDAVVIGEGEEVIKKCISLYSDEYIKSCPDKEKLKESLAGLKGIYIPSHFAIQYEKGGPITDITRLKGPNGKIKREIIRSIDTTPTMSVITTPNTIFNNTFLIEVERGCPMKCLFCAGGSLYKNQRQYSAATIKQQIEKGMTLTKKIGLVGMAVGNYGELDTMCDFLNTTDTVISVSSLRLDGLSENLLTLLKRSGYKTITFAPEAGTKRLRFKINKKITDEQIFDAVEDVLRCNIINIKLYFMVGLPGEEEEDISGIICLIKRIHHMMLTVAKAKKKIGTLTISINPFIPKAHTPFQRKKTTDLREIKKKIKTIRLELKGCNNITVGCESLKKARLQGIISMGDRRLSEVLLKMSLNEDENLDTAFSNLSVTPEFYLYRTRGKEEILPWDHIDLSD